RQGCRTIGSDAKRQPGGVSLSASTESLIQRIQGGQRIVAMRSLSASRTNNQRYKHPCLQSLACHIAHHDQNAAIRCMWNDLEKVSTHFPRRTIFALNRQPCYLR